MSKEYIAVVTKKTSDSTSCVIVVYTEDATVLTMSYRRPLTARTGIFLTLK
jgi:hypothetical protein